MARCLSFSFGKGFTFAKPDCNSTYLLRAPQEIVIVTVGNKAQKKEFKVYKELLAQDSSVFRDALNESENDVEVQEIDLGTEFKSWHFGVYVDTLYRSYFVNDFKLRKEHLRKWEPLVGTLTLWKIANRFDNSKITSIASESIRFQLSNYSTAWWKKLCGKKTAAEMLATLKSFEKAALKCEAEQLPFQDEIIQACGNMPPQIYEKHADKLLPEFAMELSKKISMRFADPDLQESIKRSSSMTPTEDGNLSLGDDTVIHLD